MSKESNWFLFKLRSKRKIRSKYEAIYYFLGVIAFSIALLISARLLDSFIG